MAVIRNAIFSILCFCILLSVRSIFQNKLVTEEIFSTSTINKSHFDAPLTAVNVRESRPTHIVEINRTSSISFPSTVYGSDTQHLCSREEIKKGSWEPVILDTPPYVPSTIHLRCYPESEYKVGQWMHTYEWLPSASSSGNCIFSDWNREDFCRLMKRATILVCQPYELFIFCLR